jgi:hypothetical protein
MTGLPIQPIDEELQTLQREVQRMLGRCLCVCSSTNN